jgi:DNA-binding MarR family transcriptional regulator
MDAVTFRKAARCISRIHDHALRPMGLRSTQLAIMWELHSWVGPALTLSALARVLVIDRSALGRGLRPLQRVGLVTLLRSQNCRARRVVLTPRGLHKLVEASSVCSQIDSKIDQLLGPHAAHVLGRILRRISGEDWVGTK